MEESPDALLVAVEAADRETLERMKGVATVAGLDDFLKPVVGSVAP